MVYIQSELRRMRRESNTLTSICLLILVVFFLNVLGMFLDPRVITGAPAWLKPAKFSISVAILAGTLAWMLRYVISGKRAARFASAIIAIFALIEIVIIDLQAARGTTSHFNVGTPLDAFLFATMAVSIVVLWLASVWLCVLFFREPFADRPLGWALRLGLLISVMGSISGGLMTRPTQSQQAEMKFNRPAVVGAHTVGAPDGGPGLPGVKWSTERGDLRIPHFFGLHGLQAIPLIYFFWIKRRPGTVSELTRRVVLAAASYAAFTILLGWQALRGQSIVAPDGITTLALGLWAATTAVAFFIRPSGKQVSHASGGAQVI